MFYRSWAWQRPYLAAGIGYPYYGGYAYSYPYYGWGWGPYYSGYGYGNPYYW